MMHRMLIGPALLLTFALLPSLARGDDSYVQHKNIVYSEVHGIALVMDIFVPKAEKNGHGVVDVISSSYNSDRSKIGDHQRAQFYQIMCGKGFTVFAIRPGSITKFSAPEMLKHVKAGIRWVKAHAAEYGVDPSALGLTGASAGGHLATLAMVTADDETRVRAVAVFFPPTDFIDWGGKQRDQGTQGGAKSDEKGDDKANAKEEDKSDGTSGTKGHVNSLTLALAFGPGQGSKTPEEITTALTAISPSRLVTAGLPPYLTIHGDADTTVPLQQSQKMVAELKAKGNSAELIVKPGGQHPWPTIPEEVVVLTDWLAKHLISK
jgi:acetyl esterase/lipase